jgi:hypothetical protein
MLMEVVHDWGDNDGLALLLLEQMVGDGPGSDWAKTIDIHVLALTEGRQRARSEYAAMLDQAGFVVDREIDTGAGIAHSGGSGLRLRA